MSVSLTHSFLLLTISVDDKHEGNEVYGIIIVSNIVSLCRYDSMEIPKVRFFVLFLGFMSEKERF